MNEAARVADDLAARLAAVEAQCDRLLAQNFVLTAQVASLAETVRDSCDRLGLEPPRRVIGEGWRMIKQVAGELNLSQSGVRARIKCGKLASEKIGGRRFVRSAK
jgi:hypothetical protein